METPRILILGIGNLLFADEGFGVRVVERLLERYDFADNVTVLDGGVLGLGLMGYVADSDQMIVIDAVRNRGNPGDLYRLEGCQIPERIRVKNSLHQIDFLEALTMCQVLDNVPEIVILGAEPEDIDTLNIELTPTLRRQVDPMVERVLAELDRLNVSYTEKDPASHVPCHSI